MATKNRSVIAVFFGLKTYFNDYLQGIGGRGSNLACIGGSVDLLMVIILVTLNVSISESSG